MSTDNANTCSRKSVTVCCNCKQEPVLGQCKCTRNRCIYCDDSVGSNTFTVCDDYWDVKFGTVKKKTNKE